MCSSKAKVTTGVEITPAPKLHGRPVLQPTCNRPVPTLERLNSLKKTSPFNFKSSTPPPPPLPLPTTTLFSNTNNNSTCSISPKGAKSPRLPSINTFNSSPDKVVPRPPVPALDRKKSKSFKETSITNTSTTNLNYGIVGGGLLPSNSVEASLSYASSLILESPGSIATVRREHMALHHAQRKMRIAHYGRSKSAKLPNHSVSVSVSVCRDDHLLAVKDVDHHHELEQLHQDEIVKRCSFITANSDPIYVAYHDEEWGVPVHDDEMLFELFVLSGAQVGSDWTSILKKRQDFREAFAGFDAEIVASVTEKQMVSISTEYRIDISRVRGVVDNANRILEIKKEFGSFDKYVWSFVNNKPISTQYKFGHKIPVKTSKSEIISKDLVRRGFRFAGPTMVHSFMQSAGLTNDHLITCHRHIPCTLLAARRPTKPIESIHD